uniref:Asparaginase n=1 Tax=viral metagenome TaxID=1070528 RepID=A0A6C0EKL8_9ZZZZ
MLTQQSKLYLQVLFGLLLFCIIVLLFSKRRYSNSERFRVHGKIKNILVIAGNSIPEKEKKKIDKLKNVNIDTIEFNSSPDISPQGWNELASVIAQKYNEYNAFVLFLQPETLTYTATALSFMLENLGKTIIVASDSHYDSIRLACSYNIPEVVILNGTAILRACRTKRFKNTFISPNYPSLGKMLKSIKIDDKVILAYPRDALNLIDVNPRKRVAIIKLYPGIDDNYIRNVVKSGKIYAIILESYGAGYVPIDRKMIAYLRDLTSKAGIIVVNVSQDLNNVSEDLSELGVISAGNMTTEAVMAKLSIIISNVKYDRAMVEQMMGINMRGEI